MRARTRNIGIERETGMEVGRYEVTWGCAAHKGSFAPVSPSGFIEPHRAWHGIPATPLYAMYQNSADPNYRGTTDAFANFNVFIETPLCSLSFVWLWRTVNGSRGWSSNKELRENVTGKLILEHSSYYILLVMGYYISKFRKVEKRSIIILYGLSIRSFDTSNSPKEKVIHNEE